MKKMITIMSLVMIVLTGCKKEEGVEPMAKKENLKWVLMPKNMGGLKWPYTTVIDGKSYLCSGGEDGLVSIIEDRCEYDGSKYVIKSYNNIFKTNKNNNIFNKVFISIDTPYVDKNFVGWEDDNPDDNLIYAPPTLTFYRID